MSLNKILTTATTLICLALTASGTDQEPTTYLSVQSNPTGAQISINHKDHDKAPLITTELPEGRYLIHASMDGYCDRFETVTLKLGIPNKLDLTLTQELGLLLVTSEPQGAEVVQEGISLGSTPLLLTDILPGKHRLSLSLPGFQTKEIDLTLVGRTPKKEIVILVADSGTMQVSSDPSEAEVMINGITRGKTPCTIDRIPGGSVKLQVKASGYLPHSREIALAAGEKQSVNITLKPLPGKLTIVSIPPGARIYIDNEFKSETPFTLKDAAPGTYRVRVEKYGHTPVARNIVVEKGITSTEEFRLTKNTGVLSIMTAPSGATILIDGKKRGITASGKTETSAVSNQLEIEDVIAGEHLIEIVRKGYGPQKRKVKIIQDQIITLQVKLSRQFIPNYEVTTFRSYYKGVLEFINEEGIRIETTPGISQTIPMKDVKSHGKLKEQ